tara:strand:- start:275 stop:862 length:588 start_codon:yes stop_codon:yes gene_type:complete
MPAKSPSYAVSSKNLRADAAAQRRQINSIFQAAAKKAPMFQKRTGSEKRYANHVASSHAFKTLSSYAAMSFADQSARESEFLRRAPRGELSRAPAMANMSAGSILMLEQVLVAFAQTAFLRAERLRKAARKHQKPSRAVISLATKWLVQEVNGTEGVGVAAPRDVVKRTKKKARAAAPEASDPPESAAKKTRHEK